MKIHTFTFNEKHLKMSTAKHWPFCIVLNVLNDISLPSILRTLVLKLQALNKDSHTKDATVSWPSYLCNANPYTWKDILYIETCLSILLSFVCCMQLCVLRDVVVARLPSNDYGGWIVRYHIFKLKKMKWWSKELGHYLNGISLPSIHRTLVLKLSVSNRNYTWWRHQMETFSALLAICAGNSLVPGEFPAQRPVTRSFDGFFDMHPNKWLSKQWRGWWFETPPCPLWRYRNDNKVVSWPSYLYNGNPYTWKDDLCIKQHYGDIIMGVIASEIISLTIVYWAIYSGTDQRKHQSSMSLAFMQGINRWPVNSPHKGPVTWKMFPFDDVIMGCILLSGGRLNKKDGLTRYGNSHVKDKTS